MEAMDQLLLACHAQTLNLFVESFLKMVQKLLESPEPQLKILATQSVIISMHQLSYCVNMNTCSLLSLQILKKILHPITEGTIFLSANSLPCVIVEIVEKLKITYV